MNKRIEDLAKQAGFETTLPYNATGKLGRFAQLVIQECANVLDREQWAKGEDWICADGRRIIAKLKEELED